MSGIGDNAYLLQLIEELCRYNDKITDEMRKEKDDLQQQVMEGTGVKIGKIACLRYVFKSFEKKNVVGFVAF